MRILHVVPSYYPAVRYGGPIRSVHALAAAQVRAGHEVQVYTTSVDGPQDLDVPVDRPVDLDGVAVHYHRVPALRRLFWAPALARALRDHVRSFDVVHNHSVFLWPTWAAARAAERHGVPYLVAPRGSLVPALIRRKSRWVKWAWLQAIERRSLARAAALHVTTELEAEDARAVGLPLPECVCVPNGVDWPAVPPVLSATPYAGLQKPFALFVGRLNWKKGLDRLLRAWPHVGVLSLVVAGNDEDGYRAQLEALARDEGVAARVTFLGEVTDEHKWALYRSAEMLVLPSYGENFGNVVAEAMAMACPVVVTREVGLAALVRSSGAGVVADGDARPLAAAINSVHADRAARQAMGARASAVARSRLSWDGVARELDQHYARLVARSAAATHGGTA